MKKMSVEECQVVASSHVHFVLRGRSGRRQVAMGVLAGLLVCSSVVFAAATPGVASASGRTLWVSPPSAMPGAKGKCNKPDYTQIQAALDAAGAGATVRICTGTYPEQLAITKDVTITTQGPVTVKLPPAPANSTTACDTLPSTNTNPPQDAISICGPITVDLNNLTVEAKWPAGTCRDSMYAIRVAGGALLRYNRSAVTAAGPSPLNSCSSGGGIGILIGTSRTTPPQVGHAEINDSSVGGYADAGIVVSSVGSTATLDQTNVTGAGPQTVLSQTGVVANRGARLTVNGGMISGNECDHPSCGPDFLTQIQSPGVGFFGAAPGSSLNGTTLSGNDQGVGYVDLSAAAPTSPTVTINDATFTGNRYMGMSLDQGLVAVNDATISGGNVGLQLVQYNGQTFGTQGTINDLTVRHAAVAAIQVLSDQMATDPAGNVTVNGARINSNAVPVSNNSSNFTLTLHDIS